MTTRPADIQGRSLKPILDNEGKVPAALGEVVNLFSILCRRIGLTRGLPFVILCMAAGKIAGSLYYFASGFQ